MKTETLFSGLVVRYKFNLFYNFQVAIHYDKLTLGTTKTELLFVEKMIRLLEIGGKCGVIVPDGVLFGSLTGHKNLRKLLLETCQLEGIVSVPSGVFKPYAGVSTAVLIFTRGGSTEKVWFYDMEADGYSLDDKRRPTDRKGDIPDIIENFRKRREENPGDRKGKCFYVPAEEIKVALAHPAASNWVFD